MTKEQALEKIKELENYIKELDSKPKRFKAEDGINYFCIENKCIGERKHYDIVYDKEYYILNNMFETKEQAEANKEKYLRKLEILEYLEDNRKEFEVGKPNYFISWEHEYNEPSIHSLCFMQRTKYVFTEEKAQECIDKFGQDLNLIFE